MATGRVAMFSRIFAARGSPALARTHFAASEFGSTKKPLVAASGSVSRAGGRDGRAVAGRVAAAGGIRTGADEAAGADGAGAAGEVTATGTRSAGAAAGAAPDPAQAAVTGARANRTAAARRGWRGTGPSHRPGAAGSSRRS
ncbi:hypothetical protein Sya03_11650 [Spirilliplanes yamanashiensis]|uniref:Uncharacterized protein n=1 Tax=Spirilliplanes yamanashiensis TaxID=42233 RepID=A0A8J4DI51_9ACTN|nr:hypothetical protein Sya03_11650 [Spirilliplanes yamanashiensis]